MNYLEEKMNAELGEKLRKERKKKHVTQRALTFEFENYLERELKKEGISEREFDDYLSGDVDEELEKKLKKIGATIPYRRLSISTVSKYENGLWRIPASYVLILEKILKVSIF